jgi:hypothetical protein
MRGVVLPRWYEQQTDPGSLAMGLPETLFPLEAAPANIDNDTPDGVTSIGSRDLSWTFDYTSDTFEYYVNGGVGFAYNGGVTDLKGSGWWPSTGGPSGALPQAHLDAPSAVDSITKTAAATRARTSGQSGILRGKLVVGNERHHPDGWHVGQYLKINDVRLPGFLNGRYYVIQRVTTTLIPGQNWRVYTIEWGDAPIARLSSRKAPAASTQPPALPGRVWEAAYSEFTPLPSSTVTVVGQLTGDDGTPRRVANVTVHLEILTWDETDTPIAPVGSLSADVVLTDTMGAWTTDLTVGSQAGYSYEVRPKAGA